MLRRTATACLLAAYLMGGAAPAPAQVPADSARAEALRDFHGPDGTGKDGPLSKAGLDLLTLYHRYRRADDANAFTPERTGLRVSDGRVTVDAIAAGETSPLLKDLERLGTTNTAAAGRVVSGRLPIDQIPAAARLETLRALTPSYARTQSARSPSAAPAPAARSSPDVSSGREAAPEPEAARTPTPSPEPAAPPPGPKVSAERVPPATPAEPASPMLFLLGSALLVVFVESR
jgi:hypothetical protein